jgi:hypothetical protein
MPGSQPDIGAVAGRYELRRLLGRGGMGAVWAARDTLLERDVAVKEIYLPAVREASAGSASPLIRRAIREARAAARLHHPGIVTVHDVVTDGDRPWIVMELVAGPSLAEAIRDQAVLTVRQTAEIGAQVLQALRAAHRQGILHRDVKPANILLAEDRVVLTDFGIAAIEGATVLTVTGQVVGSPAYLSPERINGRPATAAADVWGLGATLYTAVTGRSPFQREDTSATVAAVLTSEPEPPAHAGLLWPVLKGMLAKDPDRRLTLEQAIPLLERSTREATPARRGRGRRRPLEPETRTGTAVAPSPTVAEPTRPVPDPSAVPADHPVTHPAGGAEPVAPTAGLDAAPIAVDAAAPAAAATVDAAAATVDAAALDTAAGAAGTADAAPVTVATADTETVGTAAVRLRADLAAGTRRLRRSPAVLLLVAALAVVAVVASTVLVTQAATRRPAETGAGSAAGSAPAAAAPGASGPAGPGTQAAAAGTLPAAAPASVPPGIDPCLLGSWRITRNQSYGLIDSTRVLYTGGAGTVVTYRANGTSRTDYNRSKPRIAKYRSATWTYLERGFITQRYYAADGAITTSDTKVSATGTLRRNGKIDNSRPIEFYPEPEMYRCTGDNLTTYSNQGNFSNELVRIGGAS